MNKSVKPMERTCVHLTDPEVKKLRALSGLLRASGDKREVAGSPMRFDMSVFYDPARPEIDDGVAYRREAVIDGKPCGSAACAIGHMPMLGGDYALRPDEVLDGDIRWAYYAARQFPSLFHPKKTGFVSWSKVASFLFGSWCSRVPGEDRPGNVADRIDYFLLWRAVPSRAVWRMRDRAGQPAL